jgi:hypothetical protein
VPNTDPETDLQTDAGNERLLQTQLETQRQKVDVDHFDVTVRELVRMSAERELNRAPVYQRKFRWKEDAESRLIESLYLGLPVPSIFVAANQDGTWELIDGLQRISTLLHYVAEPREVLEQVDKDSPLQLSELRKLTSFNGILFADLPTPVQLAFFKRAIRVTVLSDKSDVDVRFDMFERLNTGGVALSAQEVRACIFRGEFSDFLRRLSEKEAFASLLKLQEANKNDGTKEELVLKFFAYVNDRNEFQGKVTDFLNAYMKAASQQFDYDAGEQLFDSVIGFLRQIIAGEFLRPPANVTPQNQLEAVMVGIAEVLRSGNQLKAPEGDWLTDPQLVEASTGATNTRTKLNRRIDRARQLFSL